MNKVVKDNLCLVLVCPKERVCVSMWSDVCLQTLKRMPPKECTHSHRSNRHVSTILCAILSHLNCFGRSHSDDDSLSFTNMNSYTQTHTNTPRQEQNRQGGHTRGRGRSNWRERGRECCGADSARNELTRSTSSRSPPRRSRPSVAPHDGCVYSKVRQTAAEKKKKIITSKSFERTGSPSSLMLFFSLFSPMSRHFFSEHIKFLAIIMPTLAHLCSTFSLFLFSTSS